MCWSRQTEVVERLGSSGLAWASVGGATNERMLIFHTGRQTNKRSAGLKQDTYWKEQTKPYFKWGHSNVYHPELHTFSNWKSLSGNDETIPQLEPFSNHCFYVSVSESIRTNT